MSTPDVHHHAVWQSQQILDSNGVAPICNHKCRRLLSIDQFHNTQKGYALLISHKKTLAGNAFYKEALQYAHALLSEGARRSVCIICVGADNNHKNWCDLTLGNIINTHGHNSVLFHNHNKQEKTIPAWLAKHLSTGHTSLIVLSADEVDTDWVKKYIPATSANYMTDVHMLSCLQNSHPTKENHLYAA